MNPVSNTAYYCCGVRMDDARRRRPLCNDIYAERFMDARGLEIYAPFRGETMPNISNISRCRIIDDYLRAELREHPAATIVTIGAGFDSRPYRLDGGHWFEIDEAQIIERKDDLLPQRECANPLRRLGIDFERESLADRLASFDAGDVVVVVIEGVFMYLEAQAIAATLRQLQQRFPRHLLLCDLMNREFFDRHARPIHEKLTAAGGRFSERPRDPVAEFEVCRYRHVEKVPMLRCAIDSGILWDELKIPGIAGRLLLDVFMPRLRGYAVHRFEYDGAKA